jgi:hypothetical protein
MHLKIRSAVSTDCTLAKKLAPWYTEPILRIAQGLTGKGVTSVDTRSFMPPLPPLSGNGHRSPAVADGLHYYSPHDNDRETTRYLSAATQIDLDYARKVVRRVVHEPYRALAPAYGADVTVVARWALDSLRRLARRDALLALTLVVGGVLCWLLYSLIPLELFWTSIGALLTLITAFIIVVHEHWVRWHKVLGKQMLWDSFDVTAAPMPSAPRVNRRLTAVGERRDGNLVVFREHAAFAGSGRKLGREQLVIDVSRGKEAEDGSATEPGQFTNSDVHAALLKAANALGLRDMHVGERIFVNGRHVRGNRELQRQPLESPFSSVSNELVRSATEHPTPDARTYVCAAIRGWQGQLMVTMFARAVHTGGWLYVEYSFYLLLPIQSKYMEVDLLHKEPLIQSLRRAAIWGVRRTIPALILSPFTFANQAVERLAWRADEGVQRYCIRRGQAFDYGARPSIREDASGGSRQHYFLARDETMYLLLLQKSLLREMENFLDEHNIASDEFRDQAKIIIDASNKNYSFHVGAVSQSTFAFGENAKASAERRAGSAG